MINLHKLFINRKTWVPLEELNPLRREIHLDHNKFTVRGSGGTLDTPCSEEEALESIEKVRLGTLGTGISNLICNEEKKCFLDKEKKVFLPHIDIESQTPVPSVPAPGFPPEYVVSTSYFPDIAAAITASGVVALDLETYGAGKKDGLDPWKGDIRLLSLKLSEGRVWLIDLMSTGYDLGPLQNALERATLVAHNAQFDLGWLRQKCGLRPTSVFCTMTASRILDNGNQRIQGYHGLAQVLERDLGVNVDKSEQTSDWGAPDLASTQIQYAAGDVEFLLPLRDVLSKALAEQGLEKTADLEMELLPAVVDLKECGFGVDVEVLGKLAEEAEKLAAENRERARGVLGRPEINLRSVPQLKAAFADLGITLPNTKEETLSELGHPAAIAVLAYRHAEKHRQQCVSYRKAIRSDGRIHATFSPMGTETGRFSCKEPNLQNVARGPLRNVFVAGAGRRLIIADYSQVELRVAAVVANDEAMLQAYRDGIDIHTKTAAAVLRKAGSDVTSDERKLAKAVNFGLLYGQRPAGLVKYAASSYGVIMTECEATTYQSNWLKAFPGIAAWHKDMEVLANHLPREKECAVRTILGRRRWLPADPQKWWARYSSLLNTPVQGAAGDGLKRAIIRLHSELPEDCFVVSTIHDELVLEVPEERADEMKAVLTKVMVEEMSVMLSDKVPIEADALVASSWGAPSSE